MPFPQGEAQMQQARGMYFGDPGGACDSIHFKDGKLLIDTRAGIGIEGSPGGGILQFGPQGRGIMFVGAGTTASQINLAASALSAQGGGAVYWETATYNMDLPIELYSNVHHKGNGATIQSTGSLDTVRSFGFDSFTGSNATTYSGAPYAFSFRDFAAITTASVSRHGMALFGQAYVLEDLKFINRGQGSALWEEYGTNTEDFAFNNLQQYYRGPTSCVRRNITIMDAAWGSLTPVPTPCDMSMGIRAVVNQNNPQIKTTYTHLLHAGMSVTIASAGGAVGINGAWTVASIVDPFQFTITTGSPGVFTSGGYVDYPVSAAWAHLGPHDSFLDHMEVIGVSTVQPARRGIMLGGNGHGSSTGTHLSQIESYQNFDVAIDMVSGGVVFDPTSEGEGAYTCCVLVRTQGRNVLPARMYSSHGGATLLSIRNSAQNLCLGQMEQAGQGEAPTAGFFNTYLETFGANDSQLYLALNHDYNTDCAVTAGSMPQRSFVNLNMDAFGLSTATLNLGWAASLSTTKAGIFLQPGGLVATTS